MADRALRILQASPADMQGGAEKVAWGLFNEYRRRGHYSWLAVGAKRSNDPDVFVIPNQAGRGRWHAYFAGLSTRLQKTASGGRFYDHLSRLAGILSEPAARFNAFFGIEEFDYPGTRQLLALPPAQTDLLHCHNLHGYYFDLRRLPHLCRVVPVFLTLHDAWLLSGHCAHALSCQKWMTGCGACPDLSLYPAVRRDATAYNWRRKRAIFSRCRLFVATPSHWLMQKVERSMLAPAVQEARVIPNGVDQTLFQPGDRQAAREQLSLAQEAVILLATGVKLRDNVWKDYATLRQAIDQLGVGLKDSGMLVVALGEGLPVEKAGRIEIQFVPFVDDPEVVARYYQAADIYVHSARADTFPTGILEAMACGLPVVATAVGGIPEQVIDEETGFLVPAGDPEGMALRIRQLVSNPELRRSMGSLGASRAAENFSLKQQASAYLDWYYHLVVESTDGKNHLVTQS